MPEALMSGPCAAAERPAKRALRMAVSVLLMLLAVAECTAGGLLYTEGRGTAQLLYLLCSLSMWVAAAVFMQWQKRWALTAVRALAVSAAVTLFSVRSEGLRSHPSLTLHGLVHDLTPVLFGMLLVILLLPSVLPRRDSEAACNCQ